MRKVIGCLIALSTTIYICGMEISAQIEAQVNTQQNESMENSFAQTLKSKVQNWSDKLLFTLSPLQYDKLLDQRSLARQQRKMLAEQAPESIQPNRKYSFSRVFKSLRTANPALWHIIRRIISIPVLIFWGNPPTLEPYPCEYSADDLMREDNALKTQDLFTNQAKEEQAARNFQIKHTFSLGALVTVLSASIATHQWGLNGKVAAVSLGIGTAASVLSWLTFGHRARIHDLTNRRDARILKLTSQHVSPQEADIAYTKIISDSKLKPFGWSAARIMRDSVKRNFSPAIHLTPEPIALATDAPVASITPDLGASWQFIEQGPPTDKQAPST